MQSYFRQVKKSGCLSTRDVAGLVADFEEVTFKPDTSVIDKERDSKRTHLSDALGYLIWQECRPQASIRRAGPKAHLMTKES